MQHLTGQEHDTKLTRDIAELLDREEDLIKRNVRGDNLEGKLYLNIVPLTRSGLRKRTLNLFLLFCESPEFNPEAARLLPVHQSFSADVRLCAGCGRFLSNKAFDAAPTGHVLGKCRQCSHVHNVAAARRDTTPYEAMLRQLQQDESAREEPSRLCFMMTADDVRNLAEQVPSCLFVSSMTCLSCPRQMSLPVCHPPLALACSCTPRLLDLDPTSSPCSHYRSMPPAQPL